MTFHKCQAYLFYTDYAKLRVVSLVQYVIVGLLLLSVLRCEVTIQSLLQIKKRILWNSRFFLTWYLLPLILSLLASCHMCFMWQKQIYGLVLVSSWRLVSFHSKMVLVAGKAPASGTWTSELFSSNHKEDMVSKENSLASGFQQKRKHSTL